jgi:hypothetical protein
MVPTRDVFGFTDSPSKDSMTQRSALERVGISCHRELLSLTYEYATTATLSSFAVAMTVINVN